MIKNNDSDLERKKMIYIADDDSSILSLYNEMIKFSFPDYKVQKHFDGNSLEKSLKLNSSHLELVITDHEMPGKSGGELIKEYAFKIKAPMILVTADYAISLKNEILNSGAYAFLNKPIDFSEFIDVIKNALKFKA